MALVGIGLWAWSEKVGKDTESFSNIGEQFLLKCSLIHEQTPEGGQEYKSNQINLNII